MAKTKKTFMEKLGLQPVEKLNKKICKERVVFLEKRIKAGKYKGRLLEQARYYNGWYKWMGKNGGTRGKAS